MKKNVIVASISVSLSFIIAYFIGSLLLNNENNVVENITPNIATNNVKQPVQEQKIFTVEELPKYSPNREELLDKFMDTVELMNKERLPFDEPRTEFGQQDGHLRNKWKDAYFTRKLKFKFNGDTYYVFGKHKDTKKIYPAPFQVCADFFVDAVDRSFGNWYSASIKRPKLVKGKFSMRDDAKQMGLHMDRSLDLRRVNDLVSYMLLRPEYFTFLFAGDGPQIGNSKFLNLWLTDSVKASVGDLVIVHGKVPWDRKNMHSHSFIISRMRDGQIDKISGNAGMSIDWNLSVESHRTPLRAVKYVVRLSDSFLEKMYE